MQQFLPNGNTKLVILIGNPVGHSLSPKMHTSAFIKIGFNAVYLACNVELSRLKQTVEAIRALNIIGANVTIPHKIEIMKYLDEIDPIANDIGAINTIVNKDGILYATNTDGIGAVRSLKESHIRLDNITTTMIGAGGVARPIAFYLLNEINHLYITDIKHEAASKLKSDLEKRYPNKISTFSNDVGTLSEILKSSDLLINCTPVGMFPNIDNTPVPISLLRKDLAVFDVVYNPIQTKLVKNALSLGAIAIGGIKMFLYQGVEGFELWTGKKAPVKLMENIIVNELSSK
ncbi:MAG: shikimate dehydrogenase [Candidatus Helarchaeota archaeon]